MSEAVRRVLSLDNASRAEVTRARVAKAVEAFQDRPGDTGSTAVQGKERCGASPIKQAVPGKMRTRHLSKAPQRLHRNGGIGLRCLFASLDCDCWLHDFLMTPCTGCPLLTVRLFV
jgi:hypothetical protein